MKFTTNQPILSVLVVLLHVSTLGAQTPSYVADVDPVTPGIQTTFATTTIGGPFTVDIYMFSPPPPAIGPPVDFNIVGLATEFNDAGPVLAIAGPGFPPPSPGTCPIACTILDGAIFPFDFVLGGAAVPGTPLAGIVFPPGASGTGGAFMGTDGGVALGDLSGLLFGGGFGLPAPGIPILLYSLSLSPAMTGISNVAPIGIFDCPPPGPPFCGPGVTTPGPSGIWPLVAEIGDNLISNVSYTALPVPAAPPPYNLVAINPGVVTVTRPLPVELSSFEAHVDGSDVLLQWETISESNNIGFEIEHLKRNHGTLPIDNWTTIAFIDGAGSTLETQHYNYVVHDLDLGMHRFRLKQIDLDGASAFSDQIEVRVDLPGTHILSAAYPNPFNPMATFTLIMAEDQSVSVEVFNSIGVRVSMLHDGMLSGNQIHQFTLDGSQLPNGTYIYRVNGSNFSENRSVSLLK